jgi:hypothetical protein
VRVSKKRVVVLTCKKFVKCAAKIRDLCMSELLSIATFALHFGDINKGDSDNT